MPDSLEDYEKASHPLPTYAGMYHPASPLRGADSASLSGPDRAPAAVSTSKPATKPTAHSELQAETPSRRSPKRKLADDNTASKKPKKRKVEASTAASSPPIRSPAPVRTPTPPPAPMPADPVPSTISNGAPKQPSAPTPGPPATPVPIAPRVAVERRNVSAPTPFLVAPVADTSHLRLRLENAKNRLLQLPLIPMLRFDSMKADLDAIRTDFDKLYQRDAGPAPASATTPRLASVLERRSSAAGRPSGGFSRKRSYGDFVASKTKK